MRAIETEYNGVLFRSRLEARWAIFFDTLGVRWEYEREGYELPSGRYVPDFWLPRYSQYVEIKGEAPTEREILLCAELHDAMLMERAGSGIIIAYGAPLAACRDAYAKRGECCVEVRFSPDNEHGFRNERVKAALCFRCLSPDTFTFTGDWKHPTWSCCDDCWSVGGVIAPDAILAAYENNSAPDVIDQVKRAIGVVSVAAKSATDHRFWNPKGRG